MIGVLVASAIGLIVVTGLSQMFANIHTQLRQMEQKSHKIFLNSLIGSELKTGCTNTLKPHGNSIIQGNGIGSFPELKDETDRVILDLGTLQGHNYFQLRCSDSPDCNCNGQSSPCNRKWTLSFISQSELNGLPVYNKNFSVDLAIKYTSAGPPPLNTSRDWKDGLSCNVSNLAHSPVATAVNCYKVTDTGDSGGAEQSLIGCGGTSLLTLDKLTVFGFKAGINTTKSENTFIGYRAGEANSTGYDNTFLGYMAGESNSTGYNNTFLGDNAGLRNTTGRSNTFVGGEAGRENSTGHGNTFLGDNAGLSNTTGNYNTFVGDNAGLSNTTGYGNTFVGLFAGQRNITGYSNTFVGEKAGKSNSTGHTNVFVGPVVGENNSTGYSNVFIGNMVGMNNTTGNRNTFIGSMAGYKNTTGNRNTFLGVGAGLSNTTGKENIFLGYVVGMNNTTGNKNTFIGPRAGGMNTTGNENTFLGKSAGGMNTTGSGNIFIGGWAAYNSAYETADNKFVMGNLANRTWIEGDIGTDIFKINNKQVSFDSPSSRTLKKNIQPYKRFDKALEDILKTPLFTYEYKKDHPEKSRMGIIAEELPKHLRLKDNSNLPHPDWISIYGTFWASIKALHEMIVDLKQDISSKFKVLISHVENLKKQLNKLAKAFSEFKRQIVDQITDISSRLLATEKKQKAILKTSQSLTKTNQNLEKAKRLLSQELTQTKFQFNESNKQLEQRYNSLAVENKNLARELFKNNKQLEQRYNSLAVKNKNLARELFKNNKQLVKTQKMLKQNQKKLKQNQKNWTVKNKQLSKELAGTKVKLNQTKTDIQQEIQALKKKIQIFIKDPSGR